MADATETVTIKSDDGKIRTIPRRDYEYLKSWDDLRFAPQSVINMARGYGINAKFSLVGASEKQKAESNVFPVYYSGAPPTQEEFEKSFKPVSPKTEITGGRGQIPADQLKEIEAKNLDVNTGRTVMGPDGQVYYEFRAKEPTKQSIFQKSPKQIFQERVLASKYAPKQGAPLVTYSTAQKPKASVLGVYEASLRNILFNEKPKTENEYGTKSNLPISYTPKTAIYQMGQGPAEPAIKARTEGREIYLRGNWWDKSLMNWGTLFSTSGEEYLGSLMPGSEIKPEEVVYQQMAKASREKTDTDILGYKISSGYVTNQALFNPIAQTTITYGAAFGLGAASAAVPSFGALMGSAGVKTALIGTTALVGTSEAYILHKKYESGERAEAMGGAVFLGAKIAAGFKGYRAGQKYGTVKFTIPREAGKLYEKGLITSEEASLIKTAAKTSWSLKKTTQFSSDLEAVRVAGEKGISTKLKTDILRQLKPKAVIGGSTAQESFIKPGMGRVAGDFDAILRGSSPREQTFFNKAFNRVFGYEKELIARVDKMAGGKTIMVNGKPRLWYSKVKMDWHEPGHLKQFMFSESYVKSPDSYTVMSSREQFFRKLVGSVNMDRLIKKEGKDIADLYRLYKSYTATTKAPDFAIDLRTHLGGYETSYYGGITKPSYVFPSASSYSFASSSAPTPSAYKAYSSQTPSFYKMPAPSKTIAPSKSTVPKGYAPIKPYKFTGGGYSPAPSSYPASKPSISPSKPSAYAPYKSAFSSYSFKPSKMTSYSKFTNQRPPAPPSIKWPDVDRKQAAVSWKLPRMATKKKYKPSIYAVVFNVKAKRAPKRLTGIEIRPIVSDRKSKKPLWSRFQ